MSTQQARYKTTRKIIRRHLRVGDWLICIDSEREVYDAVFISPLDGELIVYPTPYVKAVVGDKLKYEVVGDDEAVINSFSSPYRTFVSIRFARVLRNQMRRISSTEECHDLAKRLMCLAFGECTGFEGIRLCDVTWFNEDEMYRKIYDVVSTENMLPNPCDITILPPEPEPPGVPWDAEAVTFRATRKTWFRHTPPEYIDFAHELIHLIPEKRFKTSDAYGEEELYAYDLSPFVIELAKRGIKPPVNPVRLFEIDNTAIILEAIREVYNYEFKDLIDYFTWRGVMPMFLKPRDDGLGYELDPTYPEEIIADHVIIYFIEEMEYDEREFKVLLRLLDKLSQKQPRQGDGA
jgi:hypothetical protein